MIEVSVLMSVYNTKVNYLIEAIESILNQNEMNCKMEFIIVDDGSSNLEIEKILTSYAKRNYQIKIINNKKNLGLTKSLNIGLNECRGKYIARMDSDDISHPDRLYKQFCYMENNSNVDILGCNIKQFGDSTIRVAKFKNYMEDMKVFRIKMLFNNFGPMHPSVMIRRSFLENNNIRYREDIMKAQDYALWIDCLNAGAVFACLNERLLMYRIHGSQITTASANEQNKYKQKIISENLIRKFPINDKESKILATLYSQTYEYSPQEYINSIKNLIFGADEATREILSNELQERWIHKVAKCMAKAHDFNGMKQAYTYQCIFSPNIYRWIKSFTK